MHRFFYGVTLLVLAAAAAVSVYAYGWGGAGLYDFAGRESGPVERATAVLFFIAAIAGIGIALFYRAQLWAVFALLMAFAGAREMDWHKEWTTDSFLKTRFYLRDDIPFVEKLAGIVIILILIWCAVKLAAKLGPWIRGLIACRYDAWLAALGIGSLAFGKMLDSLARIVPVLAGFHAENRDTLGVIEESWECAGALFFLMLCAWKVTSSRR